MSDVCLPCKDGDHASHSVKFGGICVGCLCSFVATGKYDLSVLATDERMDAQRNCATYATPDGWLSNRDVAVKKNLVANHGMLVGSLGAATSIGPLLGDRPKAFRATGVLLGGTHFDLFLFVADDSDIRVIDRTYGDLFFDVVTLYGDDNVGTPLQDSPLADTTNVVIMPFETRAILKPETVAQAVEQYSMAARGLSTLAKILGGLA